MKKEEDPRFNRARLKQLHDDIQDYMDLYFHVFILPEGDKNIRKRVKEYKERIDRLLVKLEKGKISVFKDPDEIENIDWVHKVY